MSFSGKPENECLKIAQDRGDQIEKHIKEVIKNTFDEAYRFKIIKSTNLSNTIEFKKNKNYFLELYENNERFRNGIINSSSDYINRQLKRGNVFKLSEENVLRNSNNYLIDEIAIFSTICGLGYDVEVYPGPELPVLIEIANGVYDGIPPALLNRINIELKLKK